MSAQECAHGSYSRAVFKAPVVKTLSISKHCDYAFVS